MHVSLLLSLGTIRGGSASTTGLAVGGWTSWKKTFTAWKLSEYSQVGSYLLTSTNSWNPLLFQGHQSESITMPWQLSFNIVINAGVFEEVNIKIGSFIISREKKFAFSETRISLIGQFLKSHNLNPVVSGLDDLMGPMWDRILRKCIRYLTKYSYIFLSLDRNYTWANIGRYLWNILVAAYDL